jgi:hypothetical protein
MASRSRARLVHSTDDNLPGVASRMKPYLPVMLFSMLALAVVLVPDTWTDLVDLPDLPDLPRSERYVLGAAFLVVAAILLPRGKG